MTTSDLSLPTVGRRLAAAALTAVSWLAWALWAVVMIWIAWVLVSWAGAALEAVF